MTDGTQRARGGDEPTETALTVRLTGRQAAAIRRRADGEGRSQGQIIRRAIDAALDYNAGAHDSEPVDGAPDGKHQGDIAGGLLLARARAFLMDQGVDVDRSLASVEARDADEKIRTRIAVDDAITVARSLRKAERALLFQSRGFNDGATGFTSADLREARERVELLTEALAELCCHDPELIRMARES